MDAALYRAIDRSYAFVPVVTPTYATINSPGTAKEVGLHADSLVNCDGCG